MKENFLHFLWKLKLFDFRNLFLVTGEKIEIISCGIHNHNAGPDFLEAKIRIGEQLWVGNVEIHLKSSDWYLHQHEKDALYDSVILHVVWEHDIDIFRQQNKSLECLQLREFVDNKFLINYKKLFNKPKKWIQCENLLQYSSEFTRENWKEKLYIERLEIKTTEIKSLLAKQKNNWEATFYIFISSAFGFKINKESFFEIANSVDFSIISKLFNNPLQFEAFLFGQAGLLNDSVEGVYFQNLKNEYEYICHKYQIKIETKQNVLFFRLRPSNFPTIRLSQLASLYIKHKKLFSICMDITDINDFYSLFSVEPYSFWNSHYVFSKESGLKTKKVTKSFIDILILNCIIPFKFTFMQSKGLDDYSSILEIASKISPEKNAIISNFQNLKMKVNNATVSQALLQLKNNYCNKQHCLMCEIGKEIIQFN